MELSMEIVEEYSLRQGSAAGIFFFLVTGLVTGLVPNPLYVRMVPVTLLDYFFLGTTSILAALYFGKEQCSTLGDRFAGIAGVTGFLAFGCPVCNVILLTFFSSSALLTYFDPLRPFLGVFSTILLGAFVYVDMTDR
jgi:thiamine transporter ThiT